MTKQKRRLWEIAQIAIDTQDRAMAEGLAIRLEQRHGLNMPGIHEFLAAHSVDVAEWEELLR